MHQQVGTNDINQFHLPLSPPPHIMEKECSASSEALLNAVLHSEMQARRMNSDLHWHFSFILKFLSEVASYNAVMNEAETVCNGWVTYKHIIAKKTVYI